MYVMVIHDMTGWTTMLLGYLLYPVVGNNNMPIYPVRFPRLYKHLHNQPGSSPMYVYHYCGGVYRIITYISSPALVCNIGEGIDINVLMLYVFCL